ncbi:hypothetical protein C444_20906 [Haloarcula japonica DSM 6131]|uniref:Uncharacterized protein n=1 Tax=Haloarcula japonica (strain ATCC 49778 / DSM 6131 / JCM 7785 / NBRC 101032 / NCIMB 13157 / TR-1) TaxID=1227453 RepID=M0L0J5_HALJT|nr:hypothetical protein C444_20906 [Haloarcula japonica DSM 6131]
MFFASEIESVSVTRSLYRCGVLDEKHGGVQPVLLIIELVETTVGAAFSDIKYSETLRPTLQSPSERYEY